MARTTISLPDEILREAKEYASETGRTFSGLISICLQKRLDRGKADDKE